MAGCGCGGSKTGPTSYNAYAESGNLATGRTTEIEAAAAADRLGGTYTAKS